MDALLPNKIPKKSRNAINNAKSNKGIIFCKISLWGNCYLNKKQMLKIDTTYETFIRLVLYPSKLGLRKSLSCDLKTLC